MPPPSQRRPWMISLIVTVVIALGAAVGAIGWRDYAWGLFVGLPYFIGFFPVALLRRWGPRPLRACLLLAGQVGVVLTLSFLILGIEGMICILMALPVGLPGVLLGAWMAYLLLHRTALLPPGGTAVCLVLALAVGLWAEVQWPRVAPTYTVTDTVTIAASPQAVWHALITMGSLEPPTELLFRLGVAWPQHVEIQGTGEGALRIGTLTTGPLHERITVWQPGRLLRWESILTPPPLKELNPFRDTDPPHLHGLYRSVDGQFALTALGPNLTRVTRSSSYQHGLYPAAYWRLWCDYVAHRGHVHILSALKRAAEQAAVAADTGASVTP